METAQITKLSIGALVADRIAWDYLERCVELHDKRANLLRQTARG